MRVAIIGSGPAGFYAAEALLKRTDAVVHVDMFDRLPTPFGLVRGGVAPDHQRMKTITRAYEKTASHPSFRFLGNVCFGRDLSVEDLRRHYHQIVYAMGNEADRRLGIPGEGITRCTPSSVFVGWYNGHPDYKDARIDLSVSAVAVIGHGNVGVDTTRLLLRSAEELAATDIAGHALAALRQSRIRDVFLIGRGGPEDATFTPKELGELGHLEDVDIIVEADDLAAAAVVANPEGSKAEQNLHILQSYAARPLANRAKRLHLRFWTSPSEVIADSAGGVAALMLNRNNRQAAPERLPVGMVLTAIGFAGNPIPGVPFDEKLRLIANDDGRVVAGPDRRPVGGEYVVGWARTGPQGLIGSHKAASAHVVNHMMVDGAGLEQRPVPEPEAIISLLQERETQIVSLDDWRRLDEVETARGERRGAPRDKIVDVEAMLRILGG
ncbi:MAG TPA: FAD-dependent oxidoreductase [Rhodospirillaceae bacterium]|nr:FAD-dependent oxidoreductase [Rhodospirillaceae bacterium]